MQPRRSRALGRRNPIPTVAHFDECMTFATSLVGELVVHKRGARTEDHEAALSAVSNSPASGCQPALACGSTIKMQKTTYRKASNQDSVSDETSGDNLIDVAVGKRIKKRRLQLHISQTALGAAIGVSFQQVQKYERGANRVSAAAIYEIAHVLDVPIAFFFEELSERSRTQYRELTEKARAREEFVATNEGQRLVDAFMVAPKKMRSKFITLIATFTSADL